MDRLAALVLVAASGCGRIGFDATGTAGPGDAPTAMCMTSLDFTAMAWPTARPFSATLRDLDVDGRLDLIVSNIGNSISVLLGNGDGTFGPRMDTTTGSTPMALAVGMLDADNQLDVVVACTDSSTLRAFHG